MTLNRTKFSTACLTFKKSLALFASTFHSTLSICVFFIAITFATCQPSFSQSGRPIIQSGNVTPTHGWCITTNGIAQDCGTAAIPFLSTLGTVGQGDTICAWSALSTSGASQKICLGANTTTGADITVQNFGTAAAKNLTFNLNGIAYPFPGTGNGNVVGPTPTVIGDLATWNNLTGTLLQDASGTTVNGNYTWSGQQAFNGSAFAYQRANPSLNVKDTGTSWATFGAIGGGNTDGVYFGQNGTVGTLFGNASWGFLINNINAGIGIGTNGTPNIWDYPSGGIYVGGTPTDPGANNLRVQNNLQIGAIPVIYSTSPFAVHPATNVNAAIYNNSGTIIFQGTNDANATIPLDINFSSVTAPSTQVESTLTVGIANISGGTINIAGTISGQTVITAPGAVGTNALALPNVASDTLIAKTTTDTLTNKTITSSTNTLGGVTMGLGSDATGDIYYNNGGVLTRLPIGSSTNVLAVSGGAPHWSAAVGGGLTYLCTITASNSASLNNASPTSGSCPINSTYTSYVLIFQNLIPATNERIMEFQVHSASGGAGYKNSGYITSYSQFVGGTIGGSGAITTYIPLTFPTSGNGAAIQNVAPGYSGWIQITNPSATALIMINSAAAYLDGSGVLLSTSASGYWNTSAAVDGFQVLMDSGNITSGSILVYGVQ